MRGAKGEWELELQGRLKVAHASTLPAGTATGDAGNGELLAGVAVVGGGREADRSSGSARDQGLKAANLRI